jgi:FixJ family two-component response regulator
MTTPMRTIAVIDDDLRVRESLQSLLASFGYKAVTHPSARAFLTSKTLARTDCIIADINMPQMTGIELLQQLRSDRSDVPVILITGMAAANSEVFCLNKGANGFFRKPVDGQALLRSIERLLG